MRPEALLMLGRRRSSVVVDDPITAGRNYFTDAAGRPWTYQGVSMFLLFSRWLKGENIGPVCDWCASLGANVVRVLGMVGWTGNAFGPSQTANWWAGLLPFLDYLASRRLRAEFTVFADAQIMMPDQTEQRAHLRRVVDAVGSRWNVFIEVANEPWQNGCDPPAIFSAADARSVPMAYGMYDFAVRQDADGLWRATLPVLDYVTVHNPRDAGAWPRKGKDNAEYRDGSGDGSSSDSPLWPGCHLGVVGDEPMGAAERANAAGRQRDPNPDAHFWYHANAKLNGGGSTFHCDSGLLAEIPPATGDQQQCAAAAALAWASIEPEFQTGRYTRGGLDTCPLVFNPAQFPEETSRIYARLLGDRAVGVAISPTPDWVPQPAPGWRIVRTVGPQQSLVHLAR